MRISDPTLPQAEPELHRFTVEEYMRLGESFPRSELLDRLIYDKSRADEAEPDLHRFTVEEYIGVRESATAGPRMPANVSSRRSALL